MATHILTGFGFGPIQGGLFAKEAFHSHKFSRIVIAEVDQHLVDAVRANGGSYFVNVAAVDGIDVHQIDDVELLNPGAESDRAALAVALSESTEIVTCLPSVDFYDMDPDNGVAALIAEGLAHDTAAATIIYAAENNNHAAEILGQAVTRRIPAHSLGRTQWLNTVIGKMSRVVTDSREIEQLGLTAIAPGIDRAFLVEQFNRILVSQTTIPNFTPGIGVFIEKPDLLPFEEAKLYGHNAIHALLGFVGAMKGYTRMPELDGDPKLMRLAQDAFLIESGGALTCKHAKLGDDLFTQRGYTNYADDLLRRMTNPYLADSVARVTRDVIRKLGIDGRIFGTMRLALAHGIKPRNMAVGALAGLALLMRQADDCGLPPSLRVESWCDLSDQRAAAVLRWIWGDEHAVRAEELATHVVAAKSDLDDLLDAGC